MSEHYENAVAWLEDHGGESRISDYWMRRAQIEATLALAYEQRTANLLAYIQPVECADGSVIKINPEAARTIFRELNERLGRPTGMAVIK